MVGDGAHERSGCRVLVEVSRVDQRRRPPNASRGGAARCGELVRGRTADEPRDESLGGRRDDRSRGDDERGVGDRPRPPDAVWFSGCRTRWGLFRERASRARVGLDELARGEIRNELEGTRGHGGVHGIHRPMREPTLDGVALEGSARGCQHHGFSGKTTGDGTDQGRGPVVHERVQREGRRPVHRGHGVSVAAFARRRMVEVVVVVRRCCPRPFYSSNCETRHVSDVSISSIWRDSRCRHFKTRACGDAASCALA